VLPEVGGGGVSWELELNRVHADSVAAAGMPRRDVPA
jgi:hypothetical protein